jgi:hypothetical protein
MSWGWWGRWHRLAEAGLADVNVMRDDVGGAVEDGKLPRQARTEHL